MQETATVRNGELRLNLELRRGLPVTVVDRRLQEACRGKDLCSRALGFYFADLEERGAHAELGFKSVAELARIRLQMAPSTANEYKAVSRALEQLPQLEAAFAHEELCWSQVRLLARVATPQTDEAWVTYAKGKSVRKLKRKTESTKPGKPPSDDQGRRIHGAKFKVIGEMPEPMWRVWESARQKLQNERGEVFDDASLMHELAKMAITSSEPGTLAGRQRENVTAYRVSCVHVQPHGVTLMPTEDGVVELDESELALVIRDVARCCGDAGCGDECGLPHDWHLRNQGTPVPLELRAAPTPAKLREQVLLRDGLSCRCCGSRKNLMSHHAWWRQFGGPTVSWNLFCLCILCRIRHKIHYADSLFMPRRRTSAVAQGDRPSSYAA